MAITAKNRQRPTAYAVSRLPSSPKSLPGAPAVTSDPRYEPFFDIHPRTGASIEVFYADRALETFGRCGAGWFWCSRRGGSSPEGQATGPFATSYAAYRHAVNS